MLQFSRPWNIKNKLFWCFETSFVFVIPVFLFSPQNLDPRFWFFWKAGGLYMSDVLKHAFFRCFYFCVYADLIKLWRSRSCKYQAIAFMFLFFRNDVISSSNQIDYLKNAQDDLKLARGESFTILFLAIFAKLNLRKIY